jgi:hypothetical protein
MENSNKIETLGVIAVKESIVNADFLDQFILEKDKEPSRDGFIYIRVKISQVIGFICRYNAIMQGYNIAMG